MKVGGVGLLTGWGPGVGSLPADAVTAAAGRPVIGIPRPSLGGDRHRRATRECLLGIAAVDELLSTLQMTRAELAGNRTALLYVTALAYAPSNRSFIEGAGGSLHFPYTAPSAVPAEVAIEYQLSGAYLIFLGGAAATIDALWYAATLLEQGACERALVLTVETFEACADLYAGGRWLMKGPLVEAAACALLLPGGPRYVYASASGPSRRPRAIDTPEPHRPARTHDPSRGVSGNSATPDIVRRQAGETLSCAPLIALAVRRTDPKTLVGLWRGRTASINIAGDCTFQSAPRNFLGEASEGAVETPPIGYNREAF